LRTGHGYSALVKEVDVSIIAPCYNEALNIPTLLERLSEAMRGRPESWEAVLVNDASTDDTQNVLTECARPYPQLSPQTHEKNRGMVAGWATGVSAARGKIVVIMDADLQYAPSDVPRLLDELARTGADMSQGYRAQTNEISLLRNWISKALSAALNLAFGTRLRDAKSNFFACRKEVLADLLSLRPEYRQFQHIFSMAAIAKGYRIVQIPVTFHSRHAGVSYIQSPLIFSVKALPDLPRAWLAFRRLRRERKAQ
jgi:glycosyltransferase involved in cell wall biosynthesis